MTLCEEHDDYYVLYESVRCPACEERKRADNEIEDLKDEVSALARELRERGDTQ